MQTIKKIFFYLLLLFNLISSQSFGQIDKGTIKGKVFDPEYGSVVGANIILLETNLGAAVDTNGNYIVRNVPFGQYGIKCSYPGYPPGIDTINITNENSEITLDFQLTVPKIPIVMPDSLQRYHNLMATLDESEIIEIHIDSISKNFYYF